MSDWKTWPVQPPPSLGADLERGTLPFSVMAVYTHKRVADLVGEVGPFLTYAMRDANPNLPPDRAAHVLLQPFVNAIFGEYAAMHPPTDSLEQIVRNFAQMVSNCIMEQAQFDPNARPNAGVKPN